jgi:hypothetical protein
LVGYQIGRVDTHSKHRTDRALAFHNRDLIGAPISGKRRTSGETKHRREL